MKPPPVAHDGYGRVAKGLLRWGTWLLLAFTPAALLCGDASLLFMHGDLKGDRARLDATNLRRALAFYRDRHGGWPREERWAASLVAKQVLEREPLDPWEQPYRYRLLAQDGGQPAPCITSAGRDGVPDTDDDPTPTCAAQVSSP